MRTMLVVAGFCVAFLMALAARPVSAAASKAEGIHPADNHVTLAADEVEAASKDKPKKTKKDKDKDDEDDDNNGGGNDDKDENNN